jgi:hypothetical protein
MSTTTTPDRNSTRGRGIPRWVFVFLGLFDWLVGVPLAHGVLPLALSWLAPRYGWTAGYPGTWNWLGLIPIAAGTAMLIWDFASGLARARELPERMQRLVPPFLMTNHRFSFCCDRDGCRNRATPPSVRFLGRKVYLGAVVMLISASR